MQPAKPSSAPNFDDILAAHSRISPHIHRTPIMTCTHLNKLTGAELFFKCENFQRIGAFKLRGGLNAILTLDEESAAKGVVAHSSGNHAQAVAWAARQRGIPAYLVMPEDATRAKVDAVRELGGIVEFCTPEIEDRRRVVNMIIEKNGSTLIHPFDIHTSLPEPGPLPLNSTRTAPGSMSSSPLSVAEVS